MKRDWIEKLIGPADRNLLLNFYVVFSRFEYAMKRAGYFKQHRKGSKKANPKAAKWPEPDWDALATDLKGTFAKSSDPMFKLAWNYLVEMPPRTQVVRDGIFEWRDSQRVAGETDEQFVLRMVRKVRANLFHAGTFPVTGVQEESARNTYLVQATLSVLSGIASTSERLRPFIEATAD